ncbi:MAG: translation initiation factor IF-2 [Kiritimatiellae bacterium]|nr:translation initiation factor IF-2 [Kiritimatiellia bacterium]
MKISDLASELMTTGRELIGILQERGVQVRSAQASLTPELEQYLRDEIRRRYYAPQEEAKAKAEAEAKAAEEAAAAAKAAEEAAAKAAAEAEAASPKKEKEEPKVIYAKGHVVVRELAEKLGVKPNVLVAELMRMSIFASVGMKIEFKVAEKVAEKFGFRMEHEKKAAPPPPPPKEPEPKAPEAPEKADDFAPRPPVVTFMGHVDHGKTSLLDYIRKAHVAAGESGGITQHIGAYQVDYQGRAITFLDTPGHEAFTAMRARGANLTDIAVIVIAADDGIMPQTKEAIQHAQAAKVAMIVAINKCDLRTANPDRVMRQLQQMGIAPEEWGGDTICCKVSAQTGDGIDGLLEMILLQADMLELRANPRRPAQGYVIESRLEAGMGPTANVLVKNGTLNLNDAMVSGHCWGRVKAMIDDRGAKVRKAGPSAAVKVMGLTAVPAPGDEFVIYPNDRDARKVAEERLEAERLKELAGEEKEKKPLTLDDLLKAKEGSTKRVLSVVLKTDVVGSLEAIKNSLEGIKSEKVELEIISTGAGNVTVNDVMLAAASKAVVLGFHVGKENGAGAEAKRRGVEIRLYTIIYEMIDDVKNLMTGLLDPIIKEHSNGFAAIRQIFDMGKRGKVAGCMCTKGKITLKGRVRVRRKDEILWEGRIASLRRFQNEASEVREGQECGIVLDKFTGFVEGDVIESYESERVAQEL